MILVTGGSRALVIDEAGRVVTSATVEHTPGASPPPGWAEQDRRGWWRATTEAVRAVLLKNEGSAEEIGCVGLTGQMHGAVLLDERDEPLRSSEKGTDTKQKVRSRNGRR